MTSPAVWSALADPHRRRAVELLLERPRTVSELVEALPLSQPNTSKHLRVLREAGLVRVRQDAQRRVYAIEPQPMAQLDAWLARFRGLWDERLNALERRLDEREDAMSRHGIYTTVEGHPGVRFERWLRHPIEAVWRTVTEPDELAHWFPCQVEVDLRPGGEMRFVFSPDLVLDGEVLELDPPRRFAFRWGKDLLRFDLTPEGGGTRLVLSHGLVEEGRWAAAKTAAGWHVCLDALEETVAGRGGAAPGGPSPAWREHYDAYVAAGMPFGAEVPAGA